MVGFFRRFFNKGTSSAFDLEKAVGQALMQMPRCSKQLIVASPKYKDANYCGDVAVEERDLLPWAEHHAEAVWSANNNEQTARKSLPIWLRGVDEENTQFTYIPQPFVGVLRPSTLDFLKLDIASIYCRNCNTFFGHPEMKTLNNKTAGSWSYWTDEWHCPHGHLLYHEDHEMHILRKFD